LSLDPFLVGRFSADLDLLAFDHDLRALSAHLVTLRRSDTGRQQRRGNSPPSVPGPTRVSISFSACRMPVL
jgi:hypothetical protein